MVIGHVRRHHESSQDQLDRATHNNDHHRARPTKPQCESSFARVLSQPPDAPGDDFAFLDAMRARLVLLGLDARVFPIEQNGTTLYRVRVGPYGQIDDINRIRKDLAENGIDAQVVRLK